jgi:hypothetical protein
VTPELARVLALAKRRGACVRVVDQPAWDRVSAGEPDSWLHSPFSHMSLAIEERDRVVYLLDANTNDPEAAGSVIHELGHLHATRNETVRHSNEYGWMAWEIAVAREARVRRVWDHAMKDYGLGAVPDGLNHLDGMEWGEISEREKHAVIADRMKAARKRGIVDAQGRAVWRRLPKALP